MRMLYVRQALQMLRETPLVSAISIAGTALSIATIMVVVLIYQIAVANYEPEIHRDRMLYAYSTEANMPNQKNRGKMSVEVVRECFYALETPEIVSAVAIDSRPVSLPGRRLYQEYRRISTDPAFWHIFNFTYLEGSPFTEADFLSGIRTVVISERLSRDLFQSTQSVGQTIIIDFLEFRVCGVVENVSKAADDAYAEFWVPYTTDDELLSAPFYAGMTGNFSVLLLAEKRSDFPAIRAELDRRTAYYNDSKGEDYSVNFMSGLITRIDIAMGSNGFTNVRVGDFLARTGGLLLFLLLVPVLNLTGVTQASVQRRQSEMGVRKAFGATAGTLLRQVLSENLVTTLIGGVIGFVLSFVLLFVFKSFLIPSKPMLQAEMLFQPITFILSLLFILLLNLCSAIVPALRVSRQTIVSALNEEK